MKFEYTGKGFVHDLLASFRSDDLAALRPILAEFQHQFFFYDLPPRLYLVPDANCILKDLDFLCRRRLNPVRSALEEVVDAGLVRLFAPLELEEEVQRHIPTVAANGKADPAAYFAEWDRFKKKIRFFHARDIAPVEIADPNDACYLRASRIIAADAVVSDDRVVLDSTTSIKPPVIHHELRQVSRDEAVKWGVSVQGALITILTGHALEALATSIYRKPKIGIPIAAVLGLLGFLYDRKAVKKTGTSFIRELFGSAGRGILAIAEDVEARSKSSVRSLEAIDGDKGKAGKRALDKTVHAILLYEARPIPEADIVSLVQIEGVNPWTAFPREPKEDHDQWVKRAGADLARQIAEVLRADPVFTWTGTGWTTRLLYTRPAAPAVAAIQQNQRPTLSPSLAQVDVDRPTTEVLATASSEPEKAASTSRTQRLAGSQPRKRKETVRPQRSGSSKRIPKKKGGKERGKKPNVLPNTVTHGRPRVKSRRRSAKP
jgi:hypothetical protein